jgi:hypothetical protein
VTWLRCNVNLILAVGWAVMMPVSALTPIRNSVPFLVGVSVYALAVSHFSAWRASRAERAADS